ncbi:HpcH/HpaI aldolase family protein [Arenicellales bacterium IMCC57338]
MSNKSVLESLSIGSWIQLGHPAVAEIMAAAGFDWLTVDLEHSTISLAEAENLIRIIDLKGVVPLVRLSSNNSEQIKRVMDAGAHGVIVPMVKSEAEVKRAVRAVKYPPDGDRSVGLARAQGYGTNFSEYYKWQKEESLVIVQIEHIEAVNNLEQILSVSGVDAYIVGPYDLSGSLGIPGQFENPTFLEAMKEIRDVAERLEMPGGVHVVEPDPEELKNCIADGNRFIAYGVDTRMLDVACRLGLAGLKN